jgi:hypothetical protein
MSEHDHDDWDDSVRGLLLREGRLETVPAEARRRLRRRLGLSVLATALTGTTAAASGGTRLFGTLVAKQTAGVIFSMALGASAGGAVLYVAKANSASPAEPTPFAAARERPSPPQARRVEPLQRASARTRRAETRTTSAKARRDRRSTSATSI